MVEQNFQQIKTVKTEQQSKKKNYSKTSDKIQKASENGLISNISLGSEKNHHFMAFWC